MHPPICQTQYEVGEILEMIGISTVMEQNRTLVFQTLNKLEHVHRLVIELEHPIFGFERSNIELRT